MDDELNILKERHFTAILTNNLNTAEAVQERMLHGLITRRFRAASVADAIQKNFQMLGATFPHNSDGTAKSASTGMVVETRIIDQNRKSLLDPR